MSKKQSYSSGYQDVVNELTPLVTETKQAIATLALRGAKKLDSLSSDRFFPTARRDTRPLSQHGFFKRLTIVDQVSPKINSYRDIGGYEELSVVSASTAFYARRHYFHGLSKRDGTSPYIALPMSKSPRVLAVGVTSQTEPRPDGNWESEFSPSIDSEGTARLASWPFSVHLPSRLSSLNSPEEIKDRFITVYSESLAMSGLVACGLQAFDIRLNTGNAHALMSDWSAVAGVELSAPDQPFWTASSDQYLQQYLLPSEAN